MSAPMLAAAWRELKFHPARYVATIVAIAISVGFMAAASIATATESTAAGYQSAAPYSGADLIVTLEEGPAETTTAQVADVISGTDSVEDVEVTVTLFLLLEHGTTANLSTVTDMRSDRFQWTSLIQGSWPKGSQIAMNSTLASKMGVNLGDTITVSTTSEQTLTVSGILAVPPVTVGFNPSIVDPAWAQEQFGEPYPFGNKWVVAVKDGADPAAVAQSITDSLMGISVVAKVQTLAELLDTESVKATGDVEAFKYVLWAFAGIAMVVGMITIANTFTILLAQRRRQTGLIRSIGASGKQVRHSVWTEALVLGLIGGVVGIGLACGLAAGLGAFTGSIYYGLTIPWGDVSIAVGLGVVITFLAAVLPAHRATTVAPLEALQPVTTSVHESKASTLRTVVCGIVAAAGLGVAIYSLTPSSYSLLWAILGAGIMSVGVLFAARSFVPLLVKAAGTLVRHWSPTASIASKNVERDPARASASAMALMLAVGLIITLQVGAASISATMRAKIDSEFPVDLYLVAYEDPQGSLSLPQDVRDKATRVSGVGSWIEIPCMNLRDGSFPGHDQMMVFEDRVCSYLPELAQFSSGLSRTIPDDEFMVSKNSWFADGESVPLGDLHLVAAEGEAAMSHYAFVSPPDLCPAGPNIP